MYLSRRVFSATNSLVRKLSTKSLVRTSIEQLKVGDIVEIPRVPVDERCLHLEYSTNKDDREILS